MTLRRPELGDVPALAVLGRASFVAAFGHLYAPADLAAFLASVHDADALRTEIASPDSAFQIAERDHRLVGHCKLKLVSGFEHQTGALRPMDLARLYCAPAETGQGTGAALMEWALSEARAHGSDELRLAVWSGNHGAQRFYARYGFEKIADVDFWVGSHRDDEFLYSLKL